MTALPEPITDPNELQRGGVRAFIRCWPWAWRLLSRLDRWLPTEGTLREAFRDRAFTRPWARWHRFAYIPEIRDVFFEYILTFFYEYPVRKGDTVVQIGASCGEETIRFARAVGEAGRVIAIEPVPSNVEQLRATVPPEAFPQVTIIPKAAAGETGELRFYLGLEKEGRLAEIPGENLTYEWWGVEDHLNAERYKGETVVPADTADNLLAPLALDRVDFVLVETNGTELEVVESIDAVLPLVARVGARGHVSRDGEPIHRGIERRLAAKGFETSVTDEGMVVARRPGANDA
jgi:FkbM family methyltransferase